MDVRNGHNLEPEQIRQKVLNIRRNALKMNSAKGQGHTGADLCQADILASLYFRILRLSPESVGHPDRDRFIISKGHGAGGYYCTLAEAGYFDHSELDTYLGFESRLPGHPVRGKIPGVELSTGALGHGLAVGVGLALAGKRSGRPYRVFVLTGDGELQEGSVWEAAMSAAAFGLDNLIVINDRNGLQLADHTRNIVPLEPLAGKWASFGFEVRETNGNDPHAFVQTVESIDTTSGKPHVVIAHTTKGKGVSFIENSPSWHHKVPNEQELKLALQELTA
jgi:transketolase